MLRFNLKKGAGLFFALLLFFTNTVFAEVMPEGYYRSELRFAQDNYLAYWGTGEFPMREDYGLHLTVHQESVSSMWIDLQMVVDYPIIKDRHISKFYITANGKIIDQFFPKFYDGNQDGEYEDYWSIYNIKPTFIEAIGTVATFRIIGVQTKGDLYDETSGEYIVAWTQESDPVQFKPLKVTDVETHSWLEAILHVLEALLAKIQELLNMMADKLDQLKKAVEDIYTPRPETLQAFNQAMDNLMEKMPFNELTESADEMIDKYEETRKKLSAPNSKLQIGGNVYLIPPNDKGIPVIEIPLLDLTEFKDTVDTFRKLTQAMLWIWFFHMLFMWLRPKLRVT